VGYKYGALTFEFLLFTFELTHCIKKLNSPITAGALRQKLTYIHSRFTIISDD